MEKLHELINESRNYNDFIKKLFKQDIPVVQILQGINCDIQTYYHKQKRYTMHLIKSNRLN